MMVKKMQINKGILHMSGLLLISAVLSILSLNLGRFSMPLFYVTFTLAIVSMFTYYYFKRKRNYLDFDTIFITISYIICFFSTFFYNQSYYWALFLGFKFNVQYINYASIVALIGFQAYFIGSLSVKKEVGHERLPLKVVDTKLLYVGIILCMVLFVFLGGLNYYRDIYADTGESSNPFVTHILLFIGIASIVLVATEFYNAIIQGKRYPNKLFFLAISGFCVVLMVVGNRTTASQILLPIIVMYAMFYLNIGVKKFGVFIVLGIISMWLFQNIRSNRSIEMQSQNAAMVLLDLTIPSRANYMAVEYVNGNGYTLGENMLGGIVGIIPFLASSLNLDVAKMSSAELLTKETHESLHIPEDARVGLGTTTIADCYLSFGIMGVACLMGLLGWVVGKLEWRVLNLDYYYIVIYLAFVANSVFMARASFTQPVRHVVLCFIVAFIIRGIPRLLKYKR